MRKAEDKVNVKLFPVALASSAKILKLGVERIEVSAPIAVRQRECRDVVLRLQEQERWQRGRSVGRANLSRGQQRT